MKKKDIEREKKLFRDNNRFANNGQKIVTASNGHMRFYGNLNRKQEIKDYWSNQVNALVEKYQTSHPLGTFLADAEQLERDMNVRFQDCFARGRFFYYDAIRSLSAAIKYRWCIDTQYPEPSFCPISGRLLRFIKHSSRYNTVAQMTKDEIQSIYHDFLSIAKDSEEKSIAKWELVVFNHIPKDKRNEK